MTQPLRIFISSPSDVNPERRRAALLIEKLAKDYARFFAISPVLWESEPMLASGHFQDAIVPPSESDIVVLILWSRLGTPLPAQTERREYRGIDGRVPVTGTEWEFEDALQANKQKGLPDLLAYRKKARARAEYSSAAEAEELGRQLQSLEGFWSRYFADRGEFRAAFSTFDDLDQFERRLESDLRSLIERRAAALGETATTSSSAMWLKGSPFRGLQTYQFEHAPIFFGRAEATKMAVERLVANAEGGRPFLLVLGASGAGKSSLTQAGILPALYVRGVVGGVGAWFRAIVRPGAHPSGLFASLAAALTAAHALPELLAGQSVADLANHLEVAAADPSSLIVSALTARENAARDRGDVLPYEQARLVLVVDQLEELFTLGEVTQDLRNRFVLCLQALIRSGRVFVIATMRSDYWHRAAEIPQLASLSDESGRFDLLPATQPEINEMIRRSAEAAGLTFETDPRSEIRLDASLAAEAASEPGSLPLLSFLLDSMYAADIDQEKRSTLTYASMRALGGLKGAIASRAESALLALPLNVQNEFPKVLRALVRGPTRRRAPKARFPEGSPERTIVEALLSPDTRLLIAEGDGEGAQIYLAHEALITNWERATKQIAHDADDFRTLATIEEAEAEYRAAPSHQKRGYLLRDPRLANAINLAARWGNELALELRAFIAKSDAASKAATRRRWAIAALIMICLGALAAASFGAFYVAEAQRNDALIAQSRFLARDSRAATESGDATLGTILAVAALPEKIDSPSRPLIRDAETALAYASYARRELVVFRGHQPGKAVIRNPMGSTTVITGTVYTAAFSPDGTQVISSSSDGTVRIWNPVTGAQIGQLTGPAGAGEIIAAVFSRDGKSILVVPGRRKASIWRLNSDDELIHLIDEDCAEGGPEKIWMGPVPPGRGGFSSDGKRVVTVAYESREACLWDADSGKLIAPLTYEEGQINSLEFSPDGERIMTLAKDNVPTLWDGRTGKMIAEFREPENGIFSAIFSPDSAVIVTPASDGTARIRDARTGKEIMIVRGHDGSVNAAAFSPDSAILATASQDKTVRLWDSKTGVLMKTQRDPRAPVKDAILTHLLPVTSVTFSSDGLHLLTTSNDGTVQIWDAKRGTSSSLKGHEKEIVSASFSPDGTRAITASKDKTARLWNTRGDQMAVLRGHEGEVVFAAFSGDDTRVVTTSGDATARIWDATPSGFFSYTSLEGQKGYGLRSLSFSPEGRYILTSAAYDKTAYLWDVQARKAISMYEHDADVEWAVFSPDGRRVVTSASDNTIHIWNVESGDRVAALRGEEGALYSRAVFSPDGNLMIIVATRLSDDSQEIEGDGSVRVWTLSTGELFKTLRGHAARIHAAAFSPDSLQIATGSRDRSARIWTVSSGETRQVFAGHAWVTSVEFSRDGKSVIASSTDGIAHVWDANSGSMISEMKHAERPVRVTIDLSPDGTRIATHSEQSRVRLWDSRTGALIGSLADGNVLFSKDRTRILIDSGAGELSAAGSVGTMLISARSGASYSLWDARTGALIADLHKPYAGDSWPSMSPDGAFIVMPDPNSGRIYLWDGRDGQLLSVIPTLEYGSWASAFSPDGRLFAVGFSNSTLTVWGTPPMSGCDPSRSRWRSTCPIIRRARTVFYARSCRGSHGAVVRGS